MLRDHKIIRIKSLVTQSRVIKNYSQSCESQSCESQSCANQSLDQKLFDPVGIGIKTSKVDESKFAVGRRRRTKLVLLQGCRLLRMQTAEFVKCSSLTVSPLFCRRVWFTNRGAWKMNLRSFKTHHRCQQQSIVSLVIALNLWQRDLGLINWWNTSCNVTQTLKA